MLGNRNNERHQQGTITAELQVEDDIFHRTIVSLERLELFLNGTQSKIRLIQTAAQGKRDFHDPNVDLGADAYYDELALDINALFGAAKYDDAEVFQNAAMVFIEDALSWYAGREGLPFNAVEAAIVPLFAAITRQADKAKQIDKMFDDYVLKVEELSLSTEEKYEAVKDMVEAMLKARIMSDEGTIREARDSEVEGIYTSHKRGESVDGFKRLFSFVTSYYDTTFPAKLFVKTIKQFSPIIAEQFSEINEDAIEMIFQTKRKGSNDLMPVSTKETDSNKEMSQEDIPFSTVEENCTDINERDTIIEKLYPTLVDAIKQILDEKGVSYREIKISIK